MKLYKCDEDRRGGIYGLNGWGIYGGVFMTKDGTFMTSTGGVVMA